MKPIILTDVIFVKEDSLSKGHPHIPAVCRPYNTLAIITSGSMRHTVNNRTFLLSCGDVLFIRAGSMDISEAATDFPVHFICVDFYSLEPETEMKNHYRCDDRDLLPLFVELLTVFQKHGENRVMETFEILYRILNSIRRTDLLKTEKNDYYFRITEAIRKIQLQIGDPTLTAKKLAYACHVSTVTLNRFFRKVYGMTASEYLLSRRMELAKSLLLNSTHSIGDVAEKTGYGDIYAFSHAFSRCFGISPTVWRNHPEQSPVNLQIVQSVPETYGDEVPGDIS